MGCLHSHVPCPMPHHCGTCLMATVTTAQYLIPSGPHHCLLTPWALTRPLSQSRKASPPSPSSSPGWCTWSTQEPAGTGLMEQGHPHDWGIQTPTLVPPSPSRCVSTREGTGAGEQYLGTFWGSSKTLSQCPHLGPSSPMHPRCSTHLHIPHRGVRGLVWPVRQLLVAHSLSVEQMGQGAQLEMVPIYDEVKGGSSGRAMQHCGDSLCPMSQCPVTRNGYL